MSAITGIFFRKGESVDPQLMKKMNDKLSHRGVDGSHIWVEGSVGLGHQMLHTTPESLHEKLPYIEEDLVITADARIDNREELANELDIADVETVSDSYFIMKAYEMWGEDCPDKLLGDFAFAIWDKKKEILFCARDHMGVKPFYYYVDEEMFVFGSEIKALFCVGGVPREINELKAALYLIYFSEDNNLTFYKKIKRLSASYYLIIDSNHAISRKYWELNPKYRILMNSDEDYFEKFREIFAEAIKCRLRSEFKVGFELSGGLDSSSIVAMAKQLSNNSPNQSLETYSHYFPEIPDSDEKYFIELITPYCGINSHFIRGDKTSPLENMNLILRYSDQPIDNPSMSIIWELYHKMKENDTRILLSGFGGDGTISHGKYYLREMAVNFKLKKLSREINKESFVLKKGIHEIILKKIIFPIISNHLKKFLFKYFNFNIKSEISKLNKDYYDDLSIIKFFEDQQLIHFEEKKTPHEYHFYLINNITNQSILESIDSVTSPFSIEPRFPFLDKRLIEFCYALPTKIKFRNGWIKYILRKSMENFLPQEILWYPHKIKRGSVFNKNLIFYEKNFIEHLIYGENVQINEFVNREIFKEKWENGKKGNLKDLYDVWLLVTLFIWKTIDK